MKTFLKQATLVGFLLVCLHLSALPGLGQSIITTYAGGGLPPVNGAPAVTQNTGSPVSVVSDGAGGFYFTSADHRVYRVAADGVLTVIAGNGTTGFRGDGGAATSAWLWNPQGVAVDGVGNLFIADSWNFRVRKVTPAGIISTVAGDGTSGFGGDGGPAVSAQLGYARGVAVDAAGNLFIASNNNRIRKVTSDGVISTIAGNGTAGFSGDGGPATSARLNPLDVVVDGAGNMFIADASNRVRKVDASGVISTVAGGGSYGFFGDGGAATSAKFSGVYAVSVDGSGNLFIADINNYRIRRVNPAGVISTVAGVGVYGFSGDGGPAVSAQIGYAMGVAVDAAGNLFIADTYNNRVRKVTPAGIISTAAVDGTYGSSGDGGPAASAQIGYPGGVAMDAAGNLFIADSGNNRVRKVTPAGIISTAAGDGTYGSSGDGGPAASAQLSNPVAIAVDAAGSLFIADGPRIRKVDPSGFITTLANITTGTFCIDPLDEYYGGSDVSAALAVDTAGNLFVADSKNNRIRRVTPGGVVSTVAGNGLYGFSGDGGPAVSAQLFCPSSIAVDAAGNLFFNDFKNSRIRRVTPAGIISTVAGNGGTPGGVAVDPLGNLFIVDSHRISKVTPAGILNTVAGNGTAGFSGDGGPAESAQLNSPGGVAVDRNGALFIADTGNHRIRRVALSLIPALSGVLPNIGAPGATVNVTLAGSNFVAPLTLEAGSGIAVSNIRIVTDVLATAALTIDANASLSAHSLTVSTDLGRSAGVGFTVVPQFPDLSISSSHSGNLGVGLNGVYSVNVVNVGLAVTTGAITVTDLLPVGMTFVSATGIGWSCSAAGQTVTCTNVDSLAPNASSTLTLTVAVGGSTAPHVFHAPSVTVAGDLISSNDTASDATTVATLAVRLDFDPVSLAAGRQSTLRLTLPVAFPIDISGALTVTFSPDSATPADDPAIQFATGGRQVAFTIPADTLEARFASNALAGPLGFQPGTVAGTLTFSGTLQAGSAQTMFSAAQTIARQAPAIQSVRTDTEKGFAAVITLMSTTREISTLSLRFDTNPAVRLGCGALTGCTVSGSTLTFDVQSLFDAWFGVDAPTGGLGAMRLPLSIQGKVQGQVWVTFRNSIGSSNSMSFPLP